MKHAPLRSESTPGCPVRIRRDGEGDVEAFLALAASTACLGTSSRCGAMQEQTFPRLVRDKSCVCVSRLSHGRSRADGLADTTACITPTSSWGTLAARRPSRPMCLDRVIFRAEHVGREAAVQRIVGRTLFRRSAEAMRVLRKATSDEAQRTRDTQPRSSRRTTRETRRASEQQIKARHA